MRPSLAGKTATIVALMLVLLTAVVFRFFAFPHPNDARDVDEIDYLTGGFNLFEGVAPTLHYSPAGVEAWFGYAHVAARSLVNLLSPSSREHRLPAQLRPFAAVDHAMFDLYRDLNGLYRRFLFFADVIGVLGVAAGFALGRRWAGLAGGALLGGLLGLLPLYVEHASLAKPYSIAWSLAVIALCFADAGPRRWRWSAIFLGLALASRIEMLMVLPLALLLLFPKSGTVVQWLRLSGLFVFTAAIVAELTAPWLLTNLLGNLRAIATIRFSVAPGAERTKIALLGDILWGQGLAVEVLLLVSLAITLFLRPPIAPPDDAQNAARPRLMLAWRIIVFLLGALLFSTMLHDTGYGLRHHGPAVLVLLVLAPMALAPFSARWPRAAWGIVALALAIPMVRSIQWLIDYRRVYIADDAVPWVEAHIPPGTIVYLGPELRTLLPTRAASDAMWNECARPDAFQTKFNTASVRFGLAGASPPRALSEQMMATERGMLRRMYILGGQDEVGPRFDVRQTKSLVFGVTNPVESFQRTGGVLLYRAGAPAPELGKPYVQWSADGKRNMYVYLSPDVQARLRR